jgi:FkbM family methyltransferase|tara:strand:+ start:74 stop:805 length:732 start_codon:yes stop_codon:yes gene_type:complete
LVINKHIRIINSFLKYYFYLIKNYKRIKKTENFSQEGEDLFLINFFKDKKEGFYVDVGAFHPFRISNTYALYKKGFRGINIDISATSIDFFNFARPDDINLNVGATDKFENKIFFSKKNLSFHNTLSKSLAESDIQKEPFKKKYSIECKPLSKIIDNTKFCKRKIDFLNIDAEGSDYQVLLGLDIKRYCPRIICIEISPLVDKKNENYKESKVYKYLLQNGYKLIWKGSNSFIFLFQPKQQSI